jgi:hypothetical protein
VLSMTLREHGGRLEVSVQAIVFKQPGTPTGPHRRCGVDLGIGQQWAVIAHADDTIGRVATPHLGRAGRPAPPGRPAAAAPHRRLARAPSRQRQACGPGPAGTPTVAARRSTPSPLLWRAATAPWWSRASTSPRWRAGWPPRVWS